MTTTTRTRRAKAADGVRYVDGDAPEVRVMTMHDRCLGVGLSPDMAAMVFETRFPLCDTPERAADALARCNLLCGDQWDRETMYALLLNTRKRIIGWVMLATGTADTLLVDPSTTFRAAIAAGAKAIVLGHTHPSGDPMPSEADIKVTRDLIRGGQLLKVEVLDHVILDNPGLVKPGSRGHCSMRELGYFYH